MGMKMAGGKAGRINAAQESVHKGGGDRRERPAGPKGTESAVGPQKRGDVKGAQMSNPGGNPLRAAKSELHKQHPIKHDDLGPHHGTSHHIRHEPLHGMKGRKS